MQPGDVEPNLHRLVVDHVPVSVTSGSGGVVPRTVNEASKATTVVEKVVRD